MKIRKGFTLVELIISIFIFSYIAASMATIYSTAHRHAFQNYRGDVIKTAALVSMRYFQNTLHSANRIDLPAVASRGNTLAFAVNVDQATGCYPLNVDPLNAGIAPAWHYFCLANDVSTPGYMSLYHHTGALAPGTACSAFPAAGCAGCWKATSYLVPPGTCGKSISGQTVTKLAQYVDTSNNNLFSRMPADGINDLGTVRVRLRTNWPGLTGSQRPIDFSLDTVFRTTSGK